MKQLILFLALTVTLTSCGSLKKNLTRTKEKEKTETVTNTAATNTALATSTTIATRTITEESEGIIEIPASTIIATGDDKTLNSGGIIRTETPDEIIEIREDPKTGRITATNITKAKTIPVHNKKTTVEYIDTKASAANGSTIKTTVQAKTEKSVNDKELVKRRDPGSSIFLWGFMSCILLFLLIMIVRWYLKQKGKLIP